jgi:glycerol kinase
VFVGGAAIQWLRDELRLVASASELDALAATVPDSGGVYLVPAFAGLGAPHWDPYARGALLGLTRGTGRAHVCRAALEAIALQSADLLDCMQQDTGLPLTELRVDGGAANSDLLLQIQADLLSVPVVRPADVETTARGAAYLAGLAVGCWDRPALAAMQRQGAAFAPQRDRAAMAPIRAGWARAVERARGWARP